MTDGTVLGIDLGTSQVKALLCAPDGSVLGRGTVGYDISTPRDGWAETDPGQWWGAVRTAVRAATGSSLATGPARAGAARTGPARAEVAAIAVTGQMHGVVLCTERSVALRPAILWLDRRATAEVASYRQLADEQRAALGNAPSPGMAGPLALWLSRHEPSAYRSARWMLQPKDWLRFRLTGVAVTDPTDASGTLLYDMARDTWAYDVVDALGLDPDLLPPIRGSRDLAGRLLPEAAEELGLTAGTPVAIGCADTAASLLAAEFPDGARTAPLADDAVWALLTLGSGGQWIVPVPEPKPDATGRTNLFRSVSGTYRLAGAQNVGLTLDWVRRTLNATWDDLYATAGSSPRPCPVFEPRLAAERWDQQAAGGGWTGVTLAHGREDLMHAALAGVARLLEERLADLRAAGCAPASVLVGGGGSRNAAWRDMLAGVLGVPLVPSGTPWLTARGATLLAARMLRA